MGARASVAPAPEQLLTTPLPPDRAPRARCTSAACGLALGETGQAVTGR
jgi:hypothetical protein